MVKKIASPEDLKLLRDKARAEMELRTGLKETQITVHLGTCGIAAGARDILKELAADLRQACIENVTLRQADCLGLCDQEPMLTLSDKSGRKFYYGRLDKKKVHTIVQNHVLGGRPVTDYFIKK